LASSSCTDHDSNYVCLLINNKFIDDDIFYNNVGNFLADAAYPSISNVYNLTEAGINVIMGRNKQHINKSTIKHEISLEHKDTYKSRCTVENFFSIIERYPCIINNYEKSQESYLGLFTFVLCITLAKKINILISEKNDNVLKQKHEDYALKKKEEYLKRKQLKYEKRQKEKELREKETENRKKKNIEILNKIHDNIQKYIDHDTIKSVYDKHIKKHFKNRKVSNKFLFSKYKKKVSNHIIEYIKNNELTRTEYFIFADKRTYIISVPKYSFNDLVIRNKMEMSGDIINNQINIFTDMFFG
jgi:hypothetical protein